jgi:hypothetical protein
MRFSYLMVPLILTTPALASDKAAKKNWPKLGTYDCKGERTFINVKETTVDEFTAQVGPRMGARTSA